MEAWRWIGSVQNIIRKTFLPTPVEVWFAITKKLMVSFLVENALCYCCCCCRTHSTLLVIVALFTYDTLNKSRTHTRLMNTHTQSFEVYFWAQLGLRRTNEVTANVYVELLLFANGQLISISTFFNMPFPNLLLHTRHGRSFFSWSLSSLSLLAATAIFHSNHTVRLLSSMCPTLHTS